MVVVEAKVEVGQRVSRQESNGVEACEELVYQGDRQNPKTSDDPLTLHAYL